MTQTDLAVFLAGGTVLLFMPGPTNAVMMASGATVGLRRSMPLTLVALAGYSCAITVLLTCGVLAGAHGQSMTLVLKAIAAVAMSIVAFKLWAGAASNPAARRSPGLGGVLWLTLLNPKAMIVAFGIMQPIDDTAGMTLKCAILAALVIVSATCWIALGAWTKSLSAVPSALVAKVASVTSPALRSTSSPPCSVHSV